MGLVCIFVSDVLELLRFSEANTFTCAFLPVLPFPMCCAKCGISWIQLSSTAAMALFTVPPVGQLHNCASMRHLLRTIISAWLVTSLQFMHPHVLEVPTTPPSLTTQDAASDFEQASNLFRQGSLDEALTAVQRSLARSPHSVDALNLLGLIYHQQQRYGESVATFRKALEFNPRSVETLNNLATGYATQQNLDLAEQTFRQTLRLEPRNRTANYNLGLILLATHKPKQAIKALEFVQPPDSGTLLNLTKAFLRAGNTSQGLQTAQTLSMRNPKDVKVHFSLGVVLASERKYAPAIHEFELADALKPQTFEILHDLGQTHLRNNEPAKAQPILEQALQLQPNSADTLYLLALSMSDQRRDVEALELLVQARKLATENTDILLLMARLSMKQSFYEDAIPLLNEAIKIDPRRADLHAALGESYFTVGKVPEAFEEFKSLLKLDPSARSYAFMGLYYRHLGRFDEAKQSLNQGLKADANSLPILFNLGFIAKKQGDYVRAEQYFGRALRLDPNYADALFEMGGLKMEQKKYAESIPFLRRCAQVNTRPAEAYYKLAIAERNLHQVQASERDMKVFVTLSKNSQPGPYPLQNFFAYLNRREGLTPEQRKEADLHEVEADAKQHPDNPRCLYLLAEAYLKFNRVNDALQIIDRLDVLSGADFRTLLGEGVLLAQFRLYPAAIRHFQGAIAANPASDEARYNLANTQFQNHEDVQALESLQQVSAEARKDDAYLALLGDIYARLGRTAEATQVLRQAILNSPDNDQYYFSLALAQLRADHPARAYATLQQGLARVPDSGMLYWGLGVASIFRGDASLGEIYLKKAIDLAPSRESTFTALGVFYYEAGRIAEAREVLERYREIFPHGSIDVDRIRQALDAAHVSANSAKTADLSLEARREFYQLALTLAEEDR
jgi:tetratricopeptide (TPR) repeat protein